MDSSSENNHGQSVEQHGGMGAWVYTGRQGKAGALASFPCQRPPSLTSPSPQPPHVRSPLIHSDRPCQAQAVQWEMKMSSTISRAMRRMLAKRERSSSRASLSRVDSKHEWKQQRTAMA